MLVGARVAFILAMEWRHKIEMSGISGHTQRLQFLSAIAFRHSIGHICYSLTRLSDRTTPDHLVGQRIDSDKAISVLKSSIDPSSIPRRPDPTDRNRCDLGKVVGAEHLDLVEPADRYISKSAFRIVNYVYVVSNRSRINDFQDGERWLGIKHLSLAKVLQREPDLFTVWCRCNIPTERAGLGHPPYNRVIGDADRNCLNQFNSP
jgi:hypothetical protein